MGVRVRTPRLLKQVVSGIDQARSGAVRSMNSFPTSAYWLAGKRIVEHEQQGARGAEYGEELLKNLSRDLRRQLGRGSSKRNLELTFLLSELAKSADGVCAIQELALRCSMSKPSICRFSFGRSSLTVVHTIFKSRKKYSWITTLRMARICAHGIWGCWSMNFGGHLLNLGGRLTDNLDVAYNRILNLLVPLQLSKGLQGLKVARRAVNCLGNML
jgi:DUF1016 N-terminal domain